MRDGRNEGKERSKPFPSFLRSLGQEQTSHTESQQSGVKARCSTAVLLLLLLLLLLALSYLPPVLRVPS